MARKKTNDHLVVLDSGRSLVKAKTQSDEKSFTHGLAQVTEVEYRTALARDGDPLMMRINGVPFAIGDRAITRGYQARKITADRYNEIYFGSLLAAMLYQLYDKPIKNIFLYASHPPIAIEYRQDIIAAAKGKWTVEGVNGTRTYTVQDVRCFDEPVGGVMNLLIGNDGKTYARSDVKEGSTLVLDIGGQTIDIAPLDNGRVDYTAITSADGGIIEVENRFTKLLRSEHKNKLKGANFLSVDGIRDSLRTGVFDAGVHGHLSVHELVSEATDDIIIRINSLIEEYGGLVRYNNVVFTGGGGGLLFDRICQYYDHPNIISNLGRDYFHLADDIKDVHMANVRGGWKLLKMFQKAGKI